MALKITLNTQYFLDRSELDPATGCWIWTRFKSAAGYGKTGVGMSEHGEQLAHRLAYRVLRGELITGEIDHLCRNRACVNPDHLEDVAHRENMRRAPLNSFIAKRAGAANCPRGHEYAAGNVKYYGSVKYCAACKRIATAAYRARKKEAHETSDRPRGALDQEACIRGASASGV